MEEWSFCRTSRDKGCIGGKATPDEAKSLIDAAKNHRDLVDAVANGEKNMTWAHAVLSSGFSGNKKAVTALLNGADPTIIARVLDIALSKDAIKIINRGGRSSNRKDSNEKKWTVAEINKMTKPQAVAHLSKYNISYTGNQALLINRVQRHRSLVTQISQSLLKNTIQVKGKSLTENPRNRIYKNGRQIILEPLNLRGRSYKYVENINFKGVINKKNMVHVARLLKIPLHLSKQLDKYRPIFLRGL